MELVTTLKGKHIGPSDFMQLTDDRTSGQCDGHRPLSSLFDVDFINYIRYFSINYAIILVRLGGPHPDLIRLEKNTRG